MLSNELLYRPKMGFSVPLAQWFRGPLKKRVRSALLGESLEEGEVKMVEEILNNHSGITKYGPVKSIHFGPNSALVAVDIEFDDEYSIDELEREILIIEAEIKGLLPHVDKLYLESKDL